MHTSGPGDDGNDPPGGDPRAPPSEPGRYDAQLPGLPAPPSQAASPPPTADASPRRSTAEKISIAIFIVVIGIPLGLFLFGALLFGACMLSV